MTLRPEHIEEALNKKTFDEIDPDEVLKHYGYKPEEVHCNGVGIGVWRKEEAFQKLGDIGAFMRFVDHVSSFRYLGKCSRSFQLKRRRRFQNRAGKTCPRGTTRRFNSSTCGGGEMVQGRSNHRKRLVSGMAVAQR